MGTSSSYGGPSGNNPLLPPWAQETPVLPPLPSAVPTPVPTPQTTQNPSQPTAVPVAPTPNPQVNFRQAKGAMTRYVKGGGGGGGRGGGRSGVRKAGAAYVRARGGSRASAKAAISGRAATASLGGFLSSIATRGAQEAVRALGLASLAGRSAAEVFAEISNRLAPHGATLEDAAARRAIDEALYSLYDRYDLEDGNLSRLDAMDAPAISDAIQASVSSYIFYRWLQELGDRIEQNAISADQAVQLETQVRDYVRDAVKLDLSGVDVLQLDWRGATGADIVERIFQEAFALLENA